MRVRAGESDLYYPPSVHPFASPCSYPPSVHPFASPGSAMEPEVKVRVINAPSALAAPSSVGAKALAFRCAARARRNWRVGDDD